MVAKYKRIWLKALRSGEYKQGTGTLCDLRTTFDKDWNQKHGLAYCCLGVLKRAVTGKNDFKNKILGKDFARKVGLSPPVKDPHYGHMIVHETATLVRMNDEAGYSFKQIANWIERNL
jgi:hypothetical protein